MPAIQRGYRTGLKTRDNNNVPTAPKGLVNQKEIAQAVQRAANALAPTVVRIRYDFGSDWTGDPSIFFRIILADEAARKAKLSETAQTITLALLREVNAEEQGLHAYFNFRSLSEISKLNEPAWA